MPADEPDRQDRGGRSTCSTWNITYLWWDHLGAVYRPKRRTDRKGVQTEKKRGSTPRCCPFRSDRWMPSGRSPDRSGLPAVEALVAPRPCSCCCPATLPLLFRSSVRRNQRDPPSRILALGNGSYAVD